MDSYSKEYYEIETSKANRRVWLSRFADEWAEATGKLT